MGYDVCVSSHKFVYINLQKLAEKNLYSHDDLGFITRNGQDLDDKEGVPNYPDFDYEPEPGEDDNDEKI